MALAALAFCQVSLLSARFHWGILLAGCFGACSRAVAVGLWLVYLMGSETAVRTPAERLFVGRLSHVARRATEQGAPWPAAPWPRPGCSRACCRAVAAGSLCGFRKCRFDPPSVIFRCFFRAHVARWHARLLSHDLSGFGNWFKSTIACAWSFAAAWPKGGRRHMGVSHSISWFACSCKLAGKTTWLLLSVLL